jgi:hypothetical protein
MSKITYEKTSIFINYSLFEKVKKNLDIMCFRLYLWTILAIQEQFILNYYDYWITHNL